MKPQDINNTPKKNRRSRFTFSEPFSRLAMRAPMSFPLAQTASIKPSVVLADSGVSSLEMIGNPVSYTHLTLPTILLV